MTDRSARAPDRRIFHSSRTGPGYPPHAGMSPAAQPGLRYRPEHEGYQRRSRRWFVERLDFCTSPGHVPGGGSRYLRRGAGAAVAVTNLGVFRFDNGNRCVERRRLHPGVTLEEVQQAAGWTLQVSVDLTKTSPPTTDEVRLIRDGLDAETGAAGDRIPTRNA